MNAQRLVDIFNDFVSKTTKKTVVILDNSPVHTIHLFTSFISKWEEENDVYLFFLPKYSPELNCKVRRRDRNALESNKIYMVRMECLFEYG